MRDYIKVLCDDMKKYTDDNMKIIGVLEQINIVYGGIREKLEEALKQPDDVIDKIKEFINELEQQVDKNDNLGIFGYTGSYVIEKLKDIIK